MSAPKDRDRVYEVRGYQLINSLSRCALASKDINSSLLIGEGGHYLKGRKRISVHFSA